MRPNSAMLKSWDISGMCSKTVPAKHVVECLSQDVDYYKEANGCLQRCYDYPCLIHPAHVCAINEDPPLRDGNSHELRCLHDIAASHLRALKAMDFEPSGPFITFILDLKLDSTTMFEWQRHSQGSREFPPSTALLEFVNLQRALPRTRYVKAKEDMRKLLQRTCPQNFPVMSTSPIPEWLVKQVSIPCISAKVQVVATWANYEHS